MATKEWKAAEKSAKRYHDSKAKLEKMATKATKRSSKAKHADGCAVNNGDRMHYGHHGKAGCVFHAPSRVRTVDIPKGVHIWDEFDAFHWGPHDGKTAGCKQCEAKADDKAAYWANVNYQRGFHDGHNSGPSAVAENCKQCREAREAEAKATAERNGKAMEALMRAVAMLPTEAGVAILKGLGTSGPYADQLVKCRTYTDWCLARAKETL